MQSRRSPNHCVLRDAQNRQGIILGYSAAKKSRWGRSPSGYLSRVAGIDRSTQRLLRAFESLGVSTRYIERPEIFATDISRRFIAPFGERLVHLAVADFEGLRLLKGAYNIAYVNWRYDRISTSTAEGEVLWKNQQWVLSRFDELWVGCTFLQSVLIQNGLQNAQVIPAPVSTFDHTTRTATEAVIGHVRAVPLWVDLSMSQERNHEMLQGMTGSFSALSAQLVAHRDLRVYLTVVDLGDDWKNAEALILAFAHFAERFPNSLLIVKLSSSSDVPLTERIVRDLRKCISRLMGDGFVASQSILFIDGDLSEEQEAALMRSVDFCVLTSSAEGNFHSILDAMSAETVVLSPIHTAMIDCLTEENCIVCSSTPVACDGYSLTGFQTGQITRHVASIADVYAALEKSYLLSTVELELKRKNALQTAKAFELSMIAKRIDVRLDHAIGSLSRGRL